jgi:hypothetical protein
MLIAQPYHYIYYNEFFKNQILTPDRKLSETLIVDTVSSFVTFLLQVMKCNSKKNRRESFS